jgi:predicted chitinase
MADPIQSIPIPDTPPAEAKATQGAMRGIAAIKAACAAGGLTDKYAVCAMLGIVGVESVWLPVQEGMNYSQKTLLSGLFSHVTPADAAKWYDAGKRGIPRIEFFGWLYGTRLPAGTPANGNYYGRGFIQLTGKENYVKAGKMTGLDLVNNPDLMVGTDDATMARCAKIAVEFFKWRISGWEQAQHQPGFIFKALAAVNPGDKSGSDHYKKKVRFYEYFLGGVAASPPTNKDATSTTVNKTAKQIDLATPNKKEAYVEDRTANFNTNGFTDPEGKYPLRDFMNEPDTNRLARGIIAGTHVEFKDTTRKTNIPIANTDGTYDQPQSSYNTVYPYNKVFESEGGHVLEFDDSPNGERINLYHGKGTFIEMDPNGSQINYIVGDGFYITERNGNVLINGTCNITVNGPMNVLCQGDANIEVAGQADAVFHNTVNMGVAMDLNIAVGGDYNLLVEGNYNVEVAKTSNTRAIGTMSLESTDALKLKTAKSMSMEGGDTASTAETLMKMSSSFRLETPADFQIKANTFTLDIATDTKIKTGTFLAQTLTGDLQLKSSMNINSLSGAMFNVTGTQVQLNPPSPVVIPSIEELPLLGAAKKPVDFAGNEIKDRAKENVLVDTTLNPAGEFNPNTLKGNTIASLLEGSPLPADVLAVFKGATPNIYDPKYAGVPIETKTSLPVSGVSPSNRLRVPPVDSAHSQGGLNLVPPQRTAGGEFKYEEEDEWNSAAGQKASNTLYTTSDYENNGIKNPPEQDAAPTTGGAGAGSGLSAEKQAEINAQSAFPLSYKLSEHFTLGMLTLGGKYQVADVSLPSSGSGARSLYTKQTLVANLSALCQNILEPIYKELGPCQGGGGGATWLISSGLRTEGSVAGSKATSDHNKGRAVDFQLLGNNTIENLFNLVSKLEKILPYNKLLMEYRSNGASRWIHCSYSTEGNVGQTYTYVDDKKHSTGLKKLFT